MAPAAPSQTDRAALPLHPTLLVAALIIGFWLDTSVSPAASIRSLVVGVVGALSLTVLLAAALRNRHLAGILVTGIVVVLYSKRLVYLFEDLAPRMGLPLMLVWLALIAAVLVLAFRLLRRRRLSWRLPDTTRRLNLATGLLLAATVISGTLTGRLMGAVTADQQGDVDTPVAPEAGSRPDVYLILLDGYPRADVLKSAFDLDNTPFLAGLEDRGFSVAARSHSDYLWTHVTMASALHMAYVEQIGSLRPVIDGQARLHPAMRSTVNRNPVFEFFRERGYRVAAIGSGYEELALRGADRYVDDGPINEFELKLLASTFLGNGIAALAPDFASGSHRDRIEDGLASLGDLAAEADRGPQLVVAHIPAPHQPTVYGPGGAPIAVPLNEHFYSDSPIEQGVSPDAWASTYGHQLEHINTLVEDAIDSIIANSPDPPIIILMSDHGSASRVDWVRTLPTEADPADLLERTGILFAALTPGRTDVFPDDVSPVDVFRHLLDAYYGTALGPAEAPVGGGQIPPVDPSVLD